jgi:hypothetical protein
VDQNSPKVRLTFAIHVQKNHKEYSVQVSTFSSCDMANRLNYPALIETAANLAWPVKGIGIGSLCTRHNALLNILNFWLLIGRLSALATVEKSDPGPVNLCINPIRHTREGRNPDVLINLFTPPQDDNARGAWH